MINVKLISIGAETLQMYPQLASPTVRFQLAREIMEGARAHLIKHASERLHSSRADYLAGIQPLERDGKGVVLALVGVLPNMVEHGWDGRFLQETLLSDSVRGWKVSSEGFRYRAIPFRHKTPGSGPQGGQPMGSQFSGTKNAMSLAAPHAVVEDILKLGKKVHGQAKKLISRQEAASGAKGSSRLQSGLAPLLRQHHSTDIFAGMIVNKQPVQKSGGPHGAVGFQRTYTSFRMISEKVPDKWYHPGIQAREFMEELDGWISKIAPPAIEAFVKGMVKG